MGFFDKIKKAVGKTGVNLSYDWIEDPLTFSDPMVKATVGVMATADPVTVLGIHATLTAIRKDEDGGEEKITLGEVTEVADPNCTVERNGEHVPLYPCVIQPENSEGFGVFCEGLDLASSLSDWGVTDPELARTQGIEFVLETEVDIKETSFLFDPCIKQTIQIQ